MSEKRKSERIKKTVKSEVMGEEHVSLSPSVDVSKGGIFISTPEPLSSGSEVNLSIKLGSDEELEVKGIVKWVRAEENEEGKVGMGIEFIDLDSQKEKEIEKIIK